MSGRVVGVLGGMGPAATWDFCARLTAATPASRDQDHLRVLVDADPAIPDRTAAIDGRGPSPGPRLAAMARGLERAGAEVLCMPCNTAHAFADDVRDATVVPFVDMIAATVEATVMRVPAARRVGLLATTATLDAGLYERAFEERGIGVVTPTPRQRDETMAAIYAVKSGDRGPGPREALRRAAEAAVAAGAEALVAACTEVPLALTQDDLEVPLIVSSDALAVVVVRIATRTEP